MSQATAIADEVVTALDGHLFPGFTVSATRTFVPIYDQDKGDFNTLRTTVVPMAIPSMEFVARSRKRRVDYQVTVAVQQKVADRTNPSVDPLVGLVESMADFLTTFAFTTASLVKLTNDPLVVVEHLDEHEIFTGILNLGFVAFR